MLKAKGFSANMSLSIMSYFKFKSDSFYKVHNEGLITVLLGYF